MTYGWAILIIAIVLAALFSLNLFNPYTFAPRASPGSCQIMRPNGPGSNLFVSAVGPTCTINEIPQYVAQFNGQTSYATIPFSSTGIVNFGYFTFNSYGESICFFEVEWNCGTTPAKLDTWQFVAISNNLPANQINLYLGKQPVYTGGSQGTYTVTITAWIYPTSFQQGDIINYWYGIGCRNPNSNCFAGSIANIQIYNTSLSQPEIQALYQEGIGGAPTNLQNLVGWWPLNGNSKDYSGNNNNGVPTNVIYTSSWTSGYSTP